MTNKRDLKMQKLEWQQNQSSTPMTWIEANKYAKSLGEGWRLPKKEELKCISKKSLKEIHLKPLSYWSSDSQDGDYAWIFNFDMGSIYKLSLSHWGYFTYNVYCVKDIKE